MSGVIGVIVGGMIALLAGAVLGWSAGFDDGWDAGFDSGWNGALYFAKKMVEGVDNKAILTFGALRTLLEVVKKGDAND